ncbi:hypothetical protein BC332_32034 [Capsicum chinense]|nr:hypothetical protein BC332_32034 [Capsicum chinense]
MKIIGENSGTREYVVDKFSSYISLIVATKGLDPELPRVLTTYMIIDLSRNIFECYLPSIIGDLVGLRTLNLSHNCLEGHIPASLQHLSALESLDLSSNKIGGDIVQQLVSLKSLEVLNLSHNHLVGCIPKGKQFDTFENSSYQGNDGLRGLPLSKDCIGDDGVPQMTTPVGLDDDEEEGDLISWQTVLMGFGCGLVIGLSIIYIMLSAHYPIWFSRMSTDCCSWDGVHCDEITGKVIDLDPRCRGLQGKFHSNSSLFLLSSLKQLDLSLNDFSGSLISPKFGELSSLMHLDLMYSGFTGVIPVEISHLSKLQVLHISIVDPYGLRLGPYNFELRLNNLTQLRELELYSVNISSTIPQNFSSYLTTLWLRGTELSGVLPERVFHLANLESLYLSSNSLTGPIQSNVSRLQKQAFWNKEVSPLYSLLLSENSTA